MALFCGDFHHLPNRLDGSGFIVRQHDRDQTGLICDGLLQIIRRNETRLIDSEDRYSEANLLQPLACLYDCGMFDGRGDDMILLSPVDEGSTFDGQIVGFGSASGEHNSPGSAINLLGNFAASFCYNVSGSFSLPVDA